MIFIEFSKSHKITSWSLGLLKKPILLQSLVIQRSRSVCSQEWKKLRGWSVQCFVTHTHMLSRAAKIWTQRYYMSERLTARIFRLTVMRSCQTKQTMWGRYKVKYRTPLQAAARFALEKNVLNKKHCIMVAVLNVSRNRKKRSGLL